MRLIDVGASPPCVVDVSGSAFPSIPPYVILSHTWGVEEVTLQDMQGSLAALKAKKGYNKIVGCCQKAREDGFRYVWVDTCCIDKTNSVELSEAINSMYQWYKKAHVCYAYLCDIRTAWAVNNPSGYDFDRLSYFRDSRWFTRGWTLQELIAPECVEFCAEDWTIIGTKSSLRVELASITGIDAAVLGGMRRPSECHVAERMSWAALRTTTREEDEAYSLLGLFGVHIPLIYGEGRKAFLRLQEAILRETEDNTLLAWGLCEFDTTYDAEIRRLLGPHVAVCSPLAQSAKSFRASPIPADVHSKSPYPSPYSILKQELHTASFCGPDGPIVHDPPVMTSRGLLMSLPIGRVPRAHPLQSSRVSHFAFIGCWFDGKPLCMLLSNFGLESGNVFRRMTLGDHPYYYADSDELRSFVMTRVYIAPHRAEADTTSGWLRRGPIEVYFEHLQHCALWKRSMQAFEISSWKNKSRLGPKPIDEIPAEILSRTRMDFNGSCQLIPCMTDGQEFFVVICDQTGVSITAYSWTTLERLLQPAVDSASDVLHWRAKWNEDGLRQDRVRLLEFHDGRDRATHYFKNCAIVAAYKRRPGPDGFRLELSSWSTDSRFTLPTTTASEVALGLGKPGSTTVVQQPLERRAMPKGLPHPEAIKELGHAWRYLNLYGRG